MAQAQTLHSAGWSAGPTSKESRGGPSSVEWDVIVFVWKISEKAWLSWRISVRSWSEMFQRYIYIYLHIFAVTSRCCHGSKQFSKPLLSSFHQTFSVLFHCLHFQMPHRPVPKSRKNVATTVIQKYPKLQATTKASKTTTKPSKTKQQTKNSSPPLIKFFHHFPNLIPWMTTKDPKIDLNALSTSPPRGGKKEN